MFTLHTAYLCVNSEVHITVHVLYKKLFDLKAYEIDFDLTFLIQGYLKTSVNSNN